VPSHLMDRQLYPFESIKATGIADDNGDKAFDEEPIAPPPRASGTPSVIPIAQPEATTGACS
jgi:tRNA 2-thiocytidine biosynthesis protein TtcA